ncbi:LCP family protein [Faecalimonas sp.]
MNKRKYIILGVVTMILVMIAGTLAYRTIQMKDKEKVEYKEYKSNTQEKNYIMYKGKKYKYNYDLRTILFMGIDKQGEIVKNKVGAGGQADSLMLLILDTKKESISALSISRDTMTDIKTYDADGNHLSTDREQIALQYAYGDGGKKSCIRTKEAVSNLLYQIPIQSYVSLTMEGFSYLTDILGGVEIVVPEDYTHINPMFEKGKTITLNGRTAQQYVRFRNTNETGSNNERMERQSQFVEALVKKLQTEITGTKKIAQFYHKLEPYMVTDLSEDELGKMLHYQMDKIIEKVPGKVQENEKYDEFVVDNEKLKEKVIKLFYKKEKK